MKSTLIKGVKEFLKPYAYKRSEQQYAVTACLCIMSLRVVVFGKAKDNDVRSRSESESE